MRIRVLMPLGREEQAGTKGALGLRGEEDSFPETDTRIRSEKVVLLSHWN